MPGNVSLENKSMNSPNSNPLTVMPVNEEFAIAGQLYAAQMQAAAAQGFRSVINTRPDGEAGQEQPSNASIEAAAKAAGLAYAFIPIPPGSQTEADIHAMQAALKTLPRPMLGFCRSGNRVKRLYDLARAAH
jgi:uncharacterized protein (TIGR01244 family)